MYRLYLVDYSYIKTKGFNDLIHLTVLVVHVGQFVFSWSEANRRYSQAYRRYCIGAKIPKDIFGRCASKGFMICGNTSPCEFMCDGSDLT